MKSKISLCLWFDTQAEEAARFYTSIFKDSKIVTISYYPDSGKNVHGKDAGTVLTVEFELNGQSYTALNGGPEFKFTEAISLMVGCDTQKELDYYWAKLSAEPDGGQCGWLKDKFGLSWQVVPNILPELLTDADPAKSQRVFQALMGMKKLDISGLQRAHAG